MLTITHETSNPYGTNSSSWHTYLNEWVNRYVDNPKYLEDNNLKYTRDVITSTSILEGYEVITYSILINDNQNVDKPYYDISIVRKEKEYVEFFNDLESNLDNLDERKIFNLLFCSINSILLYYYAMKSISLLHTFCN